MLILNTKEEEAVWALFRGAAEPSKHQEAMASLWEKLRKRDGLRRHEEAQFERHRAGCHLCR